MDLILCYAGVWLLDWLHVELCLHVCHSDRLAYHLCQCQYRGKGQNATNHFICFCYIRDSYVNIIIWEDSVPLNFPIIISRLQCQFILFQCRPAISFIMKQSIRLSNNWVKRNYSPDSYSRQSKHARQILTNWETNVLTAVYSGHIFIYTLYIIMHYVHNFL